VSSKSNALFGQTFLELLDERGWNSIPKREMTIRLLHLASMAGVLDLDAPRMKLARELKIPPSTLDGLLRDRLLLTSSLTSMTDEGFIDWAKANNQTTELDSQHKRVVFSVKSVAIAMSVEAYLDELGLVPDYKNNRRLLVIDLSQLAYVMTHSISDDPVQLLATLESDRSRRKRLLEDCEGSQERVLDQLLVAVREQAEKRVGEKTVDFALRMIKLAKKRMVS
jgi:hypothetical protein